MSYPFPPQGIQPVKNGRKPTAAELAILRKSLVPIDPSSITPASAAGAQFDPTALSGGAAAAASREAAPPTPDVMSMVREILNAPQSPLPPGLEEPRYGFVPGGQGPTQLPSLIDVYKQAARDAAGSAPDPYGAQAAAAAAKEAQSNAMGDYMGGMTAPHQEFSPFTPTAQREQVPIPQRQYHDMPIGPQFVAALASLLAPKQAGAIGGSLYDAKAGFTQQELNDALRTYAFRKQDANQSYEDQVRNDQYGLANLRGVEAANYNNARSDFDLGLQKAGVASTARGASAELDQLGSLSRQWTGANKKQVEASLAAGDVASASAARNAAIEANTKALDTREKILGPLLGYYSSMNAQQGQDRRLTQSEQAAMDRTRYVQSAESERARLQREATATLQHDQQQGGGAGGRTAIIQGAARNYDAAIKERAQVERQLFQVWAKQNPGKRGAQSAQAMNSEAFRQYYLSHPLWQNAWQREQDTGKIWEGVKSGDGTAGPAAPGAARGSASDPLGIR